MKASYFVFEKEAVPGRADSYGWPMNLNTLTELKEHLNDGLKEGSKATDFFIIYGSRKVISAVKVVAEFETVVEPEPKPTKG